jgi:hypothetical protein
MWRGLRADVLAYNRIYTLINYNPYFILVACHYYLRYYYRYHYVAAREASILWGLEPMVGYGMTIASLRAVLTDRNERLLGNH